MAVVTDQAAAIGVTAVPTPTTDQASDAFFMWIPWQCSMTVSGTPASAFGGNTLWSRYDFDSKAARKIQDSDSIIVTIENSNSTHGAEYLMQFRMLIKLHG